MMAPWRAILYKEWLDLVRDKRTTSNVFLMGALLGPLLAIGIFSVSLNVILDEVAGAPPLHVKGLEHAPNFALYLHQANFTIEEVQLDDVTELLNSGEAPIVLLIEPGMQKALEKGQTFNLKVYFDSSIRASSMRLQRLQGVIAQYNGTVGSLRLAARGIDRTVLRPVALEEYDTYRGDGRSAQLLSMIPYFLIIGLLQAAMFVASDVFAGERERKSLEPLLCNPLSGTQLVIGKMLVNFLVCSVVLVLSLSAFTIGSNAIPIADLGIYVSLSMLPKVALILWSVLVFIVPLMSFLAAFAKSVREAQTYLSIVMIAAFLPSLIQMILDASVVGAQYLLPLWSQTDLVNMILRDEDVAVVDVMMSFAGSSVLGFIFALLAMHQYQSSSRIIAKL